VTGDALTVVTEVETLTIVDSALNVVVTILVDACNDELVVLLGLCVVVTVMKLEDADEDVELAKTVVMAVDACSAKLGVTVIVIVTTGAVLVIVTTLGLAETVLDIGLEIVETEAVEDAETIPITEMLEIEATTLTVLVLGIPKTVVVVGP